MDLHDVVKRLVGPIKAVGETHEDEARFVNLCELTELIDLLLGDISAAAIAATREEASMKKIGVHARDFLHEIKEAD